MYDLVRAANQLFENHFRTVPTYSWIESTTGYDPLLNISSNENGIEVEAYIPGVEPGNVDISLEDGYLQISGKLETPVRKTNRNFLQEVISGEFSRKIKLNETVDTSNITAEMKNGVLYISIPRAESAKPKKIKVAVK